MSFIIRNLEEIQYKYSQIWGVNIKGADHIWDQEDFKQGILEL